MAKMVLEPKPFSAGKENAMKTVALFHQPG